MATPMNKLTPGVYNAHLLNAVVIDIAGEGSGMMALRFQIKDPGPHVNETAECVVRMLPIKTPLLVDESGEEEQ
jgi:hypothetical protein